MNKKNLFNILKTIYFRNLNDNIKYIDKSYQIVQKRIYFIVLKIIFKCNKNNCQNCE